MVDLILSREDLSFDVELISSATFACRRSKCFYSTYRLASVDPWCGSERDDTIRMTCYVAGKSIKGTEMAISILEQIPDIGKSLDYPSEDNGFTALHYACAYSNPVLVKQLLEKGANINSCDDAGHTPIWHCVAGVQPGIKVESYPRSNAIELIELLLDNGADPNLLDNKGVKFLKYLRKTNRFRGGGFKNIVNKIKSLS